MGESGRAWKLVSIGYKWVELGGGGQSGGLWGNSKGLV